MRRLLITAACGTYFALLPASANPLYLECTWQGDTRVYKYEFTLNTSSKEGAVREVTEGYVHDAKVNFTSDLIVIDYKEKSGPSLFWLKYEINRLSGEMLRQNKFVGDPSVQSWESTPWSRPITGTCSKKKVKTLF